MSAETIKELARLVSEAHGLVGEIPEDRLTRGVKRNLQRAAEILDRDRAALGEPEPTEAGGDL